MVTRVPLCLCDWGVKKPKSLTTFGESVNYVSRSVVKLYCFDVCFCGSPLFSLDSCLSRNAHTRALILMDITMICPILYSVRFVSTVIISKRFWRRIIFYDFSLYSVSLRKWWSSRETSACILWHCVYVIKQYKKYLDWMVSCLSVCFIFFITNSIFYTFANCFKRPINNMCNLWLFLESIQMIETSSLSLGSLFCYGNRLRFHCVLLPCTVTKWNSVENSQY